MSEGGASQLLRVGNAPNLPEHLVWNNAMPDVSATYLLTLEGPGYQVVTTESRQPQRKLHHSCGTQIDYSVMHAFFINLHYNII